MPGPEDDPTPAETIAPEPFSEEAEETEAIEEQGEPLGGNFA